MTEPTARRPLLSRRSLLRRGALLSGAAAVGAAYPGRSSRTVEPMHAAAVVTPWPTWIPAGLTNSYDTGQHVFNYKPANTARHRAALLAAAAGTGSAHEVFIGDSSTDGYTGSVYDRAHAWPVVYGSALAASGIPSTGTGWVRAADMGGVDPRWTYDSHWVDVYLFRYTVADGATATFTSSTAGTEVQLRYGAYANASFTVSVDGATSGPGFAQVTVGPSAAYNQTVTLTELVDTTHKVVVTSTGSPLVMLLAASVSTPDAAGLTISTMAQGGSRASGTGVTSWSDFANYGAPGGVWAAAGHYPQTPSTVWIALGGNDIYAGIAPATVANAVRAIAGRFPESDVFLVLEYQPNDISTAAWTAYASALYQVADSLNLPLFDQWARMGSYATYAAQGYAGDAIAHLNAAGYTVLGNWTASVAGVVPPQAAAASPPATSVNVVPASGAALTLPTPAVFPINFVTLSDDCALTFPSPQPGASFELVLAQSDVPHVVSWPPDAVAWPGGAEPTLSATPGALDRFGFLCLDGTRWLASSELSY